MNSKIEKDILHVKMFGSFSMVYQGKSLLGRRAKETQFTQLMQLLLHYKEEGVSRELLEEVLFGEREVSDVHHAMRTVIYNTKKRLEGMGLPKGNYIVTEKGRYHWEQVIPVEEDTKVFEQLMSQAKEAEDCEEKLKLLQRACELYKGEFLANYTGVVWIAVEARRYREMFCWCMEEAAKLMRSKQDFLSLERLGRYATQIAPFSDWETLTMEALVGLGQYEEASKLYADTADSYFEERGVRPSHKLLEMLNSLGNQLSHPYDVLDKVQEQLEENELSRGPYACSYPVFRGIYQALQRIVERSGDSIYLMMCTIVDSKGNYMKDSEQLDHLSKRLGQSICQSIRRGDVMNRYGKGQYLVLLMNTTREDCAVIEKRIDQKFLTGRQRTGIQYYVNRVYGDKTVPKRKTE